MSQKYEKISKAYSLISREISASPDKWMAFLRTACRNYKLRFDEQLLLYDSRYPEGYAKYGLFLLRRGLESESRRLWAAWEKNSGEELKEKSGTFLLWEAQLGKGGDR